MFNFTFYGVYYYYYYYIPAITRLIPLCSPTHNNNNKIPPQDKFTTVVVVVNSLLYKPPLDSDLALAPPLFSSSFAHTLVATTSVVDYKSHSLTIIRIEIILLSKHTVSTADTLPKGINARVTQKSNVVDKTNRPPPT